MFTYFPSRVFLKVDSLPAWHSFVPATSHLHLNYLRIPQRPTWIADPKQHLNHVQLATRPHHTAPHRRISELFGSDCSHWGLQCICPQYITQPAEGSLIYQVQQHSSRAAAKQQHHSSLKVEGGLRAAGCSPRLCRVGQASFFSLQTGRRVRNLHQTLTSSLPHSAIQRPLSADGLLLLLSLKATMFPLFTFAF